MLDIVRLSVVYAFIVESVIELIKYIDQITAAGIKVLGHSGHGLYKIADGDQVYRCRKFNKLKSTTDNTKHAFNTLPIDYCIKRCD